VEGVHVPVPVFFFLSVLFSFFFFFFFSLFSLSLLLPRARTGADDRRARARVDSRISVNKLVKQLTSLAIRDCCERTFSAFSPPLKHHMLFLADRYPLGITVARIAHSHIAFPRDAWISSNISEHLVPPSRSCVFDNVTWRRDRNDTFFSQR